jgi:hypothetical protein
VVHGGEDRIELVDLGLAADLESRRGGDLLKQAMADRLGSQELIVATDGRLGLARPGAKLREVRSGRELISALLKPVKVGWLERLCSWFGG